MAIEKVEFSQSYIGTALEFAAITNKDVFHVGDTFYCYDTKESYIFANGDWRAV